jgi:hypothetical protein
MSNPFLDFHERASPQALQLELMEPAKVRTGQQIVKSRASPSQNAHRA